MPGARSRPPPAFGGFCLIVLLAFAVLPEQAQSEPISAEPGATLDGVLAIVRRLSPDLAARALDT